MAQSAGKNFLRQFRDLQTREFKKIGANQFMEVWNHFDSDGNGFIEDKELDDFLKQLITSVNREDVGPEVISPTGFEEVKSMVMAAFDENQDGKIDICELAQILPMEENFLLLFRRENPLESSVEFMKVWREFDVDRSGYIEADELKMFLRHLLNQCKRDIDVNEEQLIVYADTMLQLFDRNKDGKLQISEMAKLLPVKENFLCRPMFKGANKLTKDDIDRVFNLYDRDGNKTIEDEELTGFLKDLMELVEEENGRKLESFVGEKSAEFEDFDTNDLESCKATLLEQCDVNKDGKIDKSELSMILLNYQRPSLTDTLTDPQE